MPQKLSRLTIREVSAVDKGAGEGVRILLSKRAVPLTDDQQLPPKVEQYLKREFTTEHRRALAHQGKALPDGSYPIENVEDLHNAIQAIGRAKKPGKVKAHIRSRARALGATHVLPDKWVKKGIRKDLGFIAEAMDFAKSEGGEDFATELAEMRDAHYYEGLQEAIHDASHAMKHSIESIMDEPNVTDKGAAIRESFGQYVDHVAALCPQGDVAKIAKGVKEKLMAGFKKAYTSVGQNDTTSRDAEINAKSGKPVTNEGEGDEEVQVVHGPGSAADKKTKRWKERFVKLNRMAKDDKKSKDYMDHEDNDMDEDCAKRFVDMDVAKRHAFIEANPIVGLTQKRLDNMPADVRKAIQDGKDAVERLAKRDADEMLLNVTKRVQVIGLASPAELAPHVVSLVKSAPEATEALLKALEQFATANRNQENVTHLFRTFGKGDVSPGSVALDGGDGGSAYDALMAKAQEEVDAGRAKTPEQAFAKFYESTNPEIVTLRKRMQAEGSDLIPA